MLVRLGNLVRHVLMFLRHPAARAGVLTIYEFCVTVDLKIQDLTGVHLGHKKPCVRGNLRVLAFHARNKYLVFINAINCLASVSLLVFR